VSRWATFRLVSESVRGCCGMAGCCGEWEGADADEGRGRYRGKEQIPRERADGFSNRKERVEKRGQTRQQQSYSTAKRINRETFVTASLFLVGVAELQNVRCGESNKTIFWFLGLSLSVKYRFSHCCPSCYMYSPSICTSLHCRGQTR
jgi:hypothetical protein